VINTCVEIIDVYMVLTPFCILYLSSTMHIIISADHKKSIITIIITSRVWHLLLIYIKHQTNLSFVGFKMNILSPVRLSSATMLHFLMSKFKYLIGLFYIYFSLPTRRLLILRKWKICRNKISKSRNALTNNNILIITAFIEIDTIIIRQKNFLL
jgi:hypothetical protein